MKRSIVPPFADYQSAIRQTDSLRYQLGTCPAIDYHYPMRIISGTAAGLILKVPKGYEVRPTPDLVRQAVFNSLGTRVFDTRVLELFGGTGALSLECLSRGATHTIRVERAPRHARIIEQNFEATRLPKESFQLRTQDVFTALPQLRSLGGQFDLILADPPYGEKNVGKRSESFAQRLLDDADVAHLLAPGGMFILGHSKRDTLTLVPPWEEKKILKHGDSWMRFLRIQNKETHTHVLAEAIQRNDELDSGMVMPLSSEQFWTELEGDNK